MSETLKPQPVVYQQGIIFIEQHLTASVIKGDFSLQIAEVRKGWNALLVAD